MSSVPSRSRAVVVTALGTAQTLSWASTYYVPAILADPIAGTLGLSRQWVFGAYSFALLITALLGPAVGRYIDRHGGRGILSLSNLVIAAGLFLLATASGPVTLCLAWAVLGVAMALGLYDAAFATLTSLYRQEARGAITGITLFAGFASTVSWPVSALLNDLVGWQATCLVWAGLNLVLGLPLNRFLLPATPLVPRTESAAEAPRIGWTPRRPMLLLAFVFAAGWFVAGAMGAHLPALLERAGATPVEAIAAAALVGPAQVAARVAEFTLLRRIHPLMSARIAMLLHPVGAGLLAIFGPLGVAVFAALHGAGNGLLTIARGTVPLALFGPHGYGERTGLLGAPARLLQALSPLAFGALMDIMDVQVLIVSTALCLAAFAALLAVSARPAS